MRIYTTAAVANMLGVTPETLRSWRRRGIGPPYLMGLGGYIRSRGGYVLEFADGGSMRIFQGETHWCATKPHGTVLYSEEKLTAFIDARLAPCRRLPRPFRGRLPAGRKRGGI